MESYLQKGLSHEKAFFFSSSFVKEHNFDQFDWINFNFCTELCFLHVLQAHTALYRGALPTSTSVEELISAFIWENCATGFRTAPTAGMRVHTAEVSLHNNVLLCFFILPHPSLTVSLRFVLIAIFSSFLGERSVWWEQHWSILCLLCLITHWWWSLASSSNPLSSNIQSKVKFDISIAKVPIYFFFTRENEYNSKCWHSHGKSAIGQREKKHTQFWAVMSCKSDAGLYVNWQLSLLPCDFIDTLRMESFLGAHVAVQIGFIV